MIAVDPKQPTRIGVIFGKKADRYVWSVPVTNFNKFKRQNVASIITPRIREVGANLYKLGNGRATDFNGYMLNAPPYVHIGEQQDDVTQVPADPRPELKAIKPPNLLAAVELRNKQTDAASQAKRREIFKATRTRSLAAVKKEKGESPADFEARKKALDIELGEAEWFFSECEHAHFGAAIDKTSGTGRFDIEMTPIAGTPLAQSVEQLQTKASHFANVPKTPSRFCRPGSTIR